MPGGVHADPDGITIVLVRHAEKADGSDDPPLTEAGRQRARALIEAVAGHPPDAIYASQFRRTQQTVAPLATRLGLQVRIDPVTRPIADWAQRFAAQLIADHPGETVLVAGHSNTVPVLAAQLCGCEVEPLDEAIHDRIWWITISEDGEAHLTVDRYGAPSAVAEVVHEQ